MRGKSVIRVLLILLSLLGWVLASVAVWYLIKTSPEEELERLQVENTGLLEKNEDIKISLSRADENIVRLHSQLSSLRADRIDLADRLDNYHEKDPIKNAYASVLLPNDGAPGIDGLPLIWDKDARRGGLFTGHLPSPGKDRSYQLWMAPKDSDKLISLGILAEGETNHVFISPEGVKNASAFAISVEPTGGSEELTGPIIYMGAEVD